jgi:hypothetical protein
MLGASFAVQLLLVIGGFVAFAIAVLVVALALFREEDLSVGDAIVSWLFFWGTGGH